MVANYKVKTKKRKKLEKFQYQHRNRKNVECEGQGYVHYGWRIWNQTKENQDWMD